MRAAACDLSRDTVPALFEATSPGNCTSGGGTGVELLPQALVVGAAATTPPCARSGVGMADARSGDAVAGHFRCVFRGQRKGSSASLKAQLRLLPWAGPWHLMSVTAQRPPVWNWAAKVLRCSPACRR